MCDWNGKQTKEMQHYCCDQTMKFLLPFIIVNKLLERVKLFAEICGRLNSFLHIYMVMNVS